MDTKKDGGRTHPGNTELITIRETEIDVQGKSVMVDIEIPIPCRMVCEKCGESVEWYADHERGGTVVVKIVKTGCECLENKEL